MFAIAFRASPQGKAGWRIGRLWIMGLEASVARTSLVGPRLFPGDRSGADAAKAAIRADGLPEPFRRLLRVRRYGSWSKSSRVIPRGNRNIALHRDAASPA